MKKNLLFIIVLCLAAKLNGQAVNRNILFRQGQTLRLTMDLSTTISQQAGGQAIDFNVTGTAIHSYKVTNTTSDNSTLHHDVNRIMFKFEGMGSKSFDSDIPKDMEGPLGSPVQELLKKKYDMIVDPPGKVLLVQPPTIEATQLDDRMKLVASLLKEVLDVSQPPAIGSNSIFKVLPDRSINLGETWGETHESPEGKFSNNYSLAEITDSLLIIYVAGTSVTYSKLEIMPGMEVTITLNSKTTGKIFIDKYTNLPIERILNTESNGTMQGMGGETPIISRRRVTIKLLGD